MGLVTVDDLDARGVAYATVQQAMAAIDDASAVARTIVSPHLDEVEAPDTDPGVVAIVVGMVRRVLHNPNALAQEQLGDYMYSSGGQGVASLLPTSREKKLLRRAVGAAGIGAVSMTGDLPLQPSEFHHGEL